MLLHWACQEKKKSLGYAVSEISGDNINTVKDHNIASSLTGKIAGVNITKSGSIGSGSRITIRGNNSIGGNTQALIMVDGVPIRKKKIHFKKRKFFITTPLVSIKFFVVNIV